MQKRQFSDAGDGDDDMDIDNNAKKAKLNTHSTALVSFANTSQALTTTSKAEPGRTSALMAPEVSLTGHAGAIYSIAFDPTGNHLCSGSFDKQICKCIGCLITFFRRVSTHVRFSYLPHYCSFMGRLWKLSELQCAEWSQDGCSAGVLAHRKHNRVVFSR